MEEESRWFTRVPHHRNVW